MAGPHAGLRDAVFPHAGQPEVTSTVRQGAGQAGFHWRVRRSNLSTRVLPVSPEIRMAYCKSRRPLMYRLPDDAVPSGANVRMLLDPTLMGSLPGGELPESMAGRPGMAPKSTPANRSGSRSGALIC